MNNVKVYKTINSVNIQEEIYLKRGDKGIGFKATLMNDGGNVNLDNASVIFKMGRYKIKVDVIDGVNGIVEVIFSKKHTSSYGVFKVEFEVLFKENIIESYPNNDYLTVNILKDMGGSSTIDYKNEDVIHTIKGDKGEKGDKGDTPIISFRINDKGDLLYKVEYK